MSEKSIDVLAIGNAIVDVVAREEDPFLAEHGLSKGRMALIDSEAAERLYAAMGATVETSGGSAANTAAGIAGLGGRVAFVGKVKDDQLGQIFAHDLRSTGVAFDCAAVPSHAAGPATARCLVVVTPDAERTLSTSLGVAVELGAADVEEARIADARVVLLEGYLWDSPAARDACWKAIAVARLSGTKVALTLSDVLCVDRHRDTLLKLIEGGWIDVLFANAAEVQALYGVPDLDAAADRVAKACPVAALTQSEQGSLVVAGPERHYVAPAKVAETVDTTGAGDLYAAGFLFGLTQGRPLNECGRIASVVAAESVGHLGARAQCDLRGLLDKAAA